MEERGIVLTTKTTRGNNLVIRYPVIADLEKLHEFINALSREKTFINFQGEEISLADERTYLQTLLARIERREQVQLYAWCGDCLSGSCGIKLKTQVAAHVGVFGLAVARASRRQGIGSLLMESVLREAQEQIPALRLVTLEVFGNNPVARALYEKHDFVEYGRLPGGVFHRGQHVVDVLMYKRLR